MTLQISGNTAVLYSLTQSNLRGDNLLHICAQSGNDRRLVEILKASTAVDQFLSTAVNFRSASELWMIV